MEAPRPLRESLKRVAVTLKERGVPFALGGSYASLARGGPEPVHDVDFIGLDEPRLIPELEPRAPWSPSPSPSPSRSRSRSLGAGGPLSAIDRPADEYFAGDLRERLAADDRVAELGLDVAAEGDEVTVAGVVTSEQRRRAVAEVVAETAPGVHLHNDVTVAAASRPPAAERQP